MVAGIPAVTPQSKQEGGETGISFLWSSPSAREAGKCSFSAEHIIPGLISKEEWENENGMATNSLYPGMLA